MFSVKQIILYGCLKNHTLKQQNPADYVPTGSGFGRLWIAGCLDTFWRVLVLPAEGGHEQEHCGGKLRENGIPNGFSRFAL